MKNILDAGRLKLASLELEHLSEILAIEQRSHLTPWSEKNIADAINGRQDGFGLFHNAQLIAYAFLSLVADEAELLLFVVDEKYQNQGLGKYFLSEIITTIRAKASSFFLEVRAGNAPAIQLYESIGFNRVGERRGYYTVPWGREDALIYALDLSY